MKNEELILVLLKCPHVGNKRVSRFIVENNFSLEKCISNINDIVSKEDFDHYLIEAKEELKLNRNKNIKIITMLDDKYPSKLYTVSEPVIYLYYYGNIDLLNEPSVAIIGTRHPSKEFEEQTRIITKEVSKKNVIVGGLALGIDTVGHETSLDNNGKTIAVLPAGIDNIQPTSNKELARRIVRNSGLLVSEYSVGTEISTYNYPMRDRIQAALADVIIVPEAQPKSGTMITVNSAYKEGKKVYQLVDNKNEEIKDNISIEDNYLKTIEDDININKKNEDNKYKKLIDLANAKSQKQISLF